MTQKDKDAVIAALEELKGDGTGLVAMTVEDCIAVVNGLPVGDGWVSVTERLPTQQEWLEAMNSSFLCHVRVPVPGGVAEDRIMIIPYTPYSGWECQGVIIVGWMPLPELLRAEVD